MRLIIQSNEDLVGRWTANYIASKINAANPTADKPFKLGLPTGSSPLGTYRELINLYKKGKVSFENVITFNMDEYVGLDASHPESYHFFMWENFFNHIDIKKENINLLNGVAKDLVAECDAYEEKIKAAGGIDLFLGGIGPDGHMAFNEPGSSLSSRTRIKTLASDTVAANSRFFGNDIKKVPKTALTVGVETIFEAKEVVVIVTGQHKSRALYEAVEGSVNHRCTISVLQFHRRAIIVCDKDACFELKLGTYDYFLDIEKNNLDPDTLLD